MEGFRCYAIQEVDEYHDLPEAYMRDTTEIDLVNSIRLVASGVGHTHTHTLTHIHIHIHIHTQFAYM